MPDKPDAPPKLVWSRNQQDRYNDPRHAGDARRSTVSARCCKTATRSISSATALHRKATGRSSIDSTCKHSKSERIFRSDANSYENCSGVVERRRHAVHHASRVADRSAKLFRAQRRMRAGTARAHAVSRSDAAVARHQEAACDLQARRRRAVFVHALPAAGLQRRHATADSRLGVSARV